MVLGARHCKVRTLCWLSPGTLEFQGFFVSPRPLIRSTIMADDRLVIFDTTLRDGEQSPGASMNLAEKLEVAHALRDLGVDVIEAGFPLASPGDFEAVQAVARPVPGPVLCGL